jgi:hypothetical protein
MDACPLSMTWSKGCSNNKPWQLRLTRHRRAQEDLLPVLPSRELPQPQRPQLDRSYRWLLPCPRAATYILRQTRTNPLGTYWHLSRPRSTSQIRLFSVTGLSEFSRSTTPYSSTALWGPIGNNMFSRYWAQMGEICLCISSGWISSSFAKDWLLQTTSPRVR